MRSCSALRSCFERAAYPIPENPSAAATANVINVVFILRLQFSLRLREPPVPGRPLLVVEHAAVGSFPLAHFALGVVFRHSVGLLDGADELIAPAGDDVEFIVADLAPFSLELALHLLPVAFNTVPIHGLAPLLD